MRPGVSTTRESISRPTFRLDAVLLAAPTTSFLWITSATWLALDLVIWWRYLRRVDYGFEGFFTRWDAVYYAAIARDGADAAPRVFFPLFPQVLGAVSRALGIPSVSVLGAALSLCAFAVFVAWVCRVIRTAELPAGVVPRTRAGWLFFLFAPGTFIFHTSHTEAFFLLLSFGALYSSASKRPLASGAFAAATTWTRNQGVFLSIGAALLAAAVEPERRRALRAFLIVAAMCAAAFAGFIAYNAMSAGSPLAFAQAQGGWSHVESPLDVVRTFWFGNPWQRTNADNLYRYAFYWVLLVSSALVLRKQRALGVYVAASVLVMLLQGELVNSFRFGAVLFSAMFILGDTLARRSRFAALALLLGFLGLHVLTTRAYGAGSWAY